MTLWGVYLGWRESPPSPGGRGRVPDGVVFSIPFPKLGGQFLKKARISQKRGPGDKSGEKKNKAKAEQSRNWHYCWSSLYFKDKYSLKINFISFYVKNLVKYFLKTILNFLLLRNKKFVLNLMRLRACLNYLFIKKASYRVKI